MGEGYSVMEWSRYSYTKKEVQDLKDMEWVRNNSGYHHLLNTGSTMEPHLFQLWACTQSYGGPLYRWACTQSYGGPLYRWAYTQSYGGPLYRWAYTQSYGGPLYRWACTQSYGGPLYRWACTQSYGGPLYRWAYTQSAEVWDYLYRNSKIKEISISTVSV